MLVIVVLIVVLIIWYMIKDYELYIYYKVLWLVMFILLIIVFMCMLIVGFQGFMNYCCMFEIFCFVYMDEMINFVNCCVFMQEVWVQFDQVDFDYQGLLIFIVDFDYFKKVNDVYGYEVGDEVLIYVVVQIVEVLLDYVLVVCLGGEEFGVFLFYFDIIEIYCFVEVI